MSTRTGLSFLLVAALLGCPAQGPKSPGEGMGASPGVELFPAADTELWGYARLSVFTRGRPAAVTQVSHDSGHGPVSILTADNTLMRDSDGYHTSFCAECVEGTSVTVTVGFSPSSNQPPLVRRYRIHHLPVLQLTNRVDPSTDQVIVDASESRSLSGGALVFEWTLDGRVVAGPILRSRAETLQRGAILKVTDGLVTVFGLAHYDDQGRIEISPDHYRCNAMTVASGATEDSLLNPEIKLGPDPAEGTKLEIDPATKTFKRSYALRLGFEVRGTIVSADTTFIEGQDAAGTYTDVNDPTLPQIPRRGKPRKATERDKLEPNEINAPYPNPVPRPPTLPPITTDGYDHHPDMGAMSFKNGTTGFEMTRVKVKGLVKSGGTLQMVWYDQPGHSVTAGFDASKGLELHAYFRAFMLPDADKCQKYFTYNLVVGANGVVSTNRLEILSP